jgi:hypothetical protein
VQMAALMITRLRRLLRPFLPRGWTRPLHGREIGPGPRDPSGAATELDPASPASSWAVWEVSPLQRESRRRDSE